MVWDNWAERLIEDIDDYVGLFGVTTVGKAIEVGSRQLKVILDSMYILEYEGILQFEETLTQFIYSNLSKMQKKDIKDMTLYQQIRYRSVFMMNSEGGYED